MLIDNYYSYFNNAWYVWPFLINVVFFYIFLCTIDSVFNYQYIFQKKTTTIGSWLDLIFRQL